MRGVSSLAVGMILALLAGFVSAVGIAAPASAATADYTVEITSTSTVPIYDAFTYTVTVAADTASGPSTGTVLTAQLPVGLEFSGVPTGGDSPVASAAWDPATRTVVFTLKDLTEPLTSFVFGVNQVGNTVKDANTVYDTTISGSPSEGGAVPADSATTAVTGNFTYSSGKTQSTVTGSNNRDVTYYFNMSTPDWAPSTTETFTTWGQRFVDQLPAGAVVTGTSTGLGTWVISGSSATGQTATWTRDQAAYGPTAGYLSGTGVDVWITVHYPAAVFPDGSRPPVNTVQSSVRDYSGNWHDIAPSSAQGPAMIGGSTKGVFVSKTANTAGAETETAGDGYFLRGYRVKASYLNSLDSDLLDTMVVTDGSTGGNVEYFEHLDIYRLVLDYNATLRAASVPVQLQYTTTADSSWQTMPGSFTSSALLEVLVQTTGSVGYENSTGFSADATINLPEGVQLNGWRIVLSPGGSDAAIPSGSEVTVTPGYIPLFASYVDGSTSSTPLVNTASVDGSLIGGAALPGATDTASTTFVDRVAIVTTVDAPATLPVGGTAVYTARIQNMNPTHDYTDGVMRVVLPEGVFYDTTVGATPVATTVYGTDIPVPTVGNGLTVTTETVTDAAGVAHQVVVFSFDELPSMRPLGEPSGTKPSPTGFDYNVPVTVVAQAYDPANTTAPVQSFAYTDDPRFASVPMDWYYAFFGNDSYDFDANRTRIAVWNDSSEVITAGGLLIGKLTRADAGDAWAVDAVVASPGTAEWQVYVSNVLPNPVTDLVVFDRLPFVNDGRGSAFDVAIAAAIAGAPAGSTVEYSANATAADNGTWSADPTGATSFRLSVPSLATGEDFTLVVPSTVPAGLAYADAATNNVTATGIYNAVDRSFESNPARITVEGHPDFTVVKKTNGVYYDTAPGATVASGSAVTWTYEVTNTGDTPLDAITVADSFQAGDGSTGSLTPTTTVAGALLPGEVRTFTAQGVAVPGQYHNTATVTATAVDASGELLGQQPDTAADESWYVAGEVGLDVVKQTNGEDVDSAPGLVLTPGTDATWTYVVTNTGTLPLSEIVVTDVDGDDNLVFSKTIDALAPGESVTLSATGTSVEGQYHNTVTVTAANPVAGGEISAADDSYYYGAVPGFEVSKKVATSSEGPWSEKVVVDSGGDVFWQITITNTGNTTLTDVNVSDPTVGEIPAVAQILPGESTVIIVEQTNVREGYVNTVRVSATDEFGTDIGEQEDTAAVEVTADGLAITGFAGAGAAVGIAAILLLGGLAMIRRRQRVLS
ncbi:hypothetical protein QFZ53_000402 [Microbacterium natoriense]|uniref:DUF7507 domain-containing protein n=2 Tax=Microbacterium natoriense TaxID=284570 RepID=A0AAW8ESC8_9MICO|nr:hypothetical protein [Microbacterium natoriense]